MNWTSEEQAILSDGLARLVNLIIIRFSFNYHFLIFCCCDHFFYFPEDILLNRLFHVTQKSHQGFKTKPLGTLLCVANGYMYVQSL